MEKKVDIFNKKELELMIETLSNTNNFEFDEVKKILEEVFEVSIRKKFEKGAIINVDIDENSFDLTINRVYQMIGDNWEGKIEEDDYSCEYHLYEDQVEEKFGKLNISNGDTIKDPIKNFKTDRHVTNIAKQQLKLKLNDLNKFKIKEGFLKHENELIPFIIKSYNARGYKVEMINGHIGLLPKENLFRPSEKLKVGSRQLGMLDTTKDDPSIILTRNGDRFVELLLAREVDDIFNEVVQVQGICTIEGVKTVLAVSSADQHIDAVGSCIGSRGVRVNAISDCLSNENIEIVKWDSEFANFATEFLNTEIVKIILDEKESIILVDDDADLISLLGKNSYKEKVLSKFFNKTVKVIHLQSYQDNSDFLVSYFEDALNLDEDSSFLIVNSGFDSIDSLSQINKNELANILSIDTEDAEMLRNAALQALKDRNEAISKIETNIKELDKADDFIIDLLLKGNISSKESLADLDSFELMDIIPMIDQEYAGELIMEARNA
jgi:N utilization substance protein A